MTNSSALKNTCSSEHGFTALVMIIIVTAILITLLLSLNFLILDKRISTGENLEKHYSLQLARSCLDRALLQYALDPWYAGAERFFVSQEYCEIGIITKLPTKLTIPTSASINNKVTKLETTVSLPQLNIITQTEKIN